MILALELAAESAWQARISDWLISVGCLYMMAWGAGCSTWDDSVDHANAEAFGFGDIPEDDDAMTTWHENESLSEVMWFAKNCAMHPTIELSRTLLIHVSHSPAEQELLALYANA